MSDEPFMTLADARAIFERGHTAWIGPACAYCPTGEAYTVVHVSVQGNEQDAATQWLYDMYQYGEHRGCKRFDKGWTIYWRIEPELDAQGPDSSIYARLCMTKKPVLSWEEFHRKVGRVGEPVMARSMWNTLYGAPEDEQETA